MRRKGLPVPPIDELAQWQLEGVREAARAMTRRPLHGHPVIMRAIRQAMIDGYMEGRLAEWRKQQEMALIQQALDAQ